MFNRAKKRYFRFPAMPRSTRLVFKRVEKKHGDVIYNAFRDDENPFVSQEFKSLSSATEWADYSARGAFRPKRAGCDWLMYDRQKRLVGLLHYYDLSLETFADIHKRCCVGLTVAEAFRRQGFGAEAVTHLLKYIRDKQPVIDHILAYADKRNAASAGLFQKLGFAENFTDYLRHDDFRYFALTRSELAARFQQTTTALPIVSNLLRSRRQDARR